MAKGESIKRPVNSVITMANKRTNEARESILKSVREHLTESVGHDIANHNLESAGGDKRGNDSLFVTTASSKNGKVMDTGRSPVETFKRSLEAVGGHCVVVRSELESARALKRIITGLQPAQRQRIAVSDAPLAQGVIRDLDHEVEEISITPDSNDLFSFDVGVTAAQAAIAETGTLVLESDSERHRLISLLPPVHIALVEEANIFLTLGEALSHVRHRGASGMSRTVTFITGPSRTADIELTLTIGVHGPKELYVIVNESGTD